MSWDIVEATSLVKLAVLARDKCENSPVCNLVLHGEFPQEEIESDFVRTFTPIALKWQATQPSKDLYMTHGQFIDRGRQSGREFIVDELRRKPDSNRACLSLISMSDLVDSGDDPIPSFMVLQFAFQNERYKKIQVTAYFRALEVLNFLPINIAEICDILRHLRREFPSFESFILTILAFRAYCLPSFRCLTKALLDIASPVEIALAVERRNIAQLIEWIDSKLHSTDSVVCTSGLSYLYESLGVCQDAYPTDIRRNIISALDASNEMRSIRESSSYSKLISQLQIRIQESLEAVKSILESELRKDV